MQPPWINHKTFPEQYCSIFIEKEPERNRANPVFSSQGDSIHEKKGGKKLLGDSKGAESPWRPFVRKFI